MKTKRILASIMAAALMLSSLPFSAVGAVSSTEPALEAASTPSASVGEYAGKELLANGNFDSNISDKFSVADDVRTISYDAGTDNDSNPFLHVSAITGVDFSTTPKTATGVENPLVYVGESVVLYPGTYTFSIDMRHGYDAYTEIPGTYDGSKPYGYSAYESFRNIAVIPKFADTEGNALGVRDVIDGKVVDTCTATGWGHTTHTSDIAGALTWDEGTYYGQLSCTSHISNMFRIGSEWRTATATFTVEETVVFTGFEMKTNHAAYTAYLDSYDIDNISLTRALTDVEETSAALNAGDFSGAAAIDTVAPAFEAGNKYLYLTNITYANGGLSITPTVAEGANEGKTLELWVDVSTDVLLLQDNTEEKTNYETYSVFKYNSSIIAYPRRNQDWKTLKLPNYGTVAKYGFRGNNNTSFNPFMFDNISVVDVTDAENPVVIKTETFDNAVVENRTVTINFGDVAVGDVTYNLGSIAITTPYATESLRIETAEPYYVANLSDGAESVYTYGEVIAPGTYKLTAKVKNDAIIFAKAVTGANKGTAAEVKSYIEADGGDDYYRYYSSYGTYNEDILYKDNNTVDFAVKATMSDGTVVESAKTTVGFEWTDVEFVFNTNAFVTLEEIAFIAEPTIANTTYPKAYASVAIKDVNFTSNATTVTATANGVDYATLADAIASGAKVIDLAANTYETVAVSDSLTINRNGYTAYNLSAADGVIYSSTDDAYKFTGASSAVTSVDLPEDKFTTGGNAVENIDDLAPGFVLGNEYLYVYNRLDNVDGVRVTSDYAGDAALKIQFTASVRDKLLKDSSTAEPYFRLSNNGSTYIYRKYPGKISYDYTAANCAAGIDVTAVSASYYDVIPNAFALDDLAIYDGETLVWSYDFSGAKVENGVLTIDTATQGTTPDGVEGYDLGVITISALDAGIAAGRSKEDRTTSIKIATDEQYYVATVNDVDGAAGELVYEAGDILAPGVYTFKAFLKNNELITSAYVNGVTRVTGDAVATCTYDEYFTYWGAGANYYYEVDNNKINVGVAVTLGGEKVDLSADGLVTVNSEDWTEVEYTFTVDEMTTLDAVAISAQHILSGKTLGTDNGNVIAAANYASLAFKNVTIAQLEPIDTIVIDEADFVTGGVNAALTTDVANTAGNKYLYIPASSVTYGSAGFILSSDIAADANTGKTLNLEFDVATDATLYIGSKDATKVKEIGSSLRTVHYPNGTLVNNQYGHLQTIYRNEWETVVLEAYNAATFVEGTATKLPQIRGRDYSTLNAFIIDNIRVVDVTDESNTFTVATYDFSNAVVNEDGTVTVTFPAVDGYELGTITIKPYDKEEFEIVAAEDYYTATVANGNKLAYEAGEVLKAGQYSLYASFRNNEMVMSEKVNGTTAADEGVNSASTYNTGLSNADVYSLVDGYIAAGIGFYRYYHDLSEIALALDNNKYDVVAVITLENGEVLRSEATRVGYDWADFEFVFDLDADAQIKEVAFEATHMLSDATLYESPAADHAAVAFKDVSITAHACNMDAREWEYVEGDLDNHFKICPCGEQLSEAHEWEERPEYSQAATCTEDGYTLYTCAACDAEKRETIEATGEHNYTWEEVDETSHRGYCGCDETATEILEDHTWGDIVTTLEPTCIADGTGIKTCTKCKYEVEVDIPATDEHNYENATYVNANETQHTVECTVEGCGNIKYEDHNYVDGTCVCGATEAEEVKYVAKIGETGYETLAAAIEAAAAGGTIDLLANAEAVTVAKAVTINKNGFTAEITAGANYGTIDAGDSCIVYPQLGNSVSRSLNLENKIEISYKPYLNNFTGHGFSEAYVAENARILVWTGDAVSDDALYLPGTQTETLGDGMDINGELDESDKLVKSSATSGGTKYTVYVGVTAGIEAKNMGKVQKVRFYIEDADGIGYYSEVFEFSPVAYCEGMYGRLAALDPVLEGLMNYGAAAQVYFEEDVDNLMNSFLPTDKQIVPDTVDCQPLKADDAGKFQLPVTEITSKISRSLNLQGTIEINLKATMNTAYKNAASVTVLYWNETAYNAASALTEENATAVLETTYAGGQYVAAIQGIAAKELGNTCFYCYRVEMADGTVYYGELGTFSAHQYAASAIASTHAAYETVKPLCRAMIVYSNAAATYFG